MARAGVWAAWAVLLIVGGDAVAAGREEARDEAVVAEALAIAERIAGAPTGLSPAAEHALATAIVHEARAAGLDPLLVAAVIEVESSFRPRAVSRAGAVGLMQVMPATGAWLAKRFGSPERVDEHHLFDPEWNVRLGVRYLALLVRRFGRLDEALVAYNAGPTRARRVLAGDERSRWLDGYPRKVLALREELRQSVPDPGDRRSAR